MSLLTIARYRAITGDTVTASAVVEDRIAEAVELLEEHLERPLEQAERTERMYPTADGYVWPKALPIIAAAGYTIDGAGLRIIWPNTLFVEADSSTVAVTYTGGWVERTANPDATNRLPSSLERAIAWAAKALGSTDVSELVEGLPPGAKTVTLGDLSITFDTTTASPAEIRFGRGIRKYGYRRPMGVPT